MKKLLSPLINKEYWVEEREGEAGSHLQAGLPVFSTFEQDALKLLRGRFEREDFERLYDMKLTTGASVFDYFHGREMPLYLKAALKDLHKKQTESRRRHTPIAELREIYRIVQETEIKYERS